MGHHILTLWFLVSASSHGPHAQPYIEGVYHSHAECQEHARTTADRLWKENEGTAVLLRCRPVTDAAEAGA